MPRGEPYQPPSEEQLAAVRAAREVEERRRLREFPRMSARLRVSSLEDGLERIGLRSMRAQALVRAWVVDFAGDQRYRRVLADNPAPLSAFAQDAEGNDYGEVAMWLPPSGSYLAIGGRQYSWSPTADEFGWDDEHLDQFRIAARVTRTRLVVEAWPDVGVDELVVRFDEPAPLARVCPSCRMELLATGERGTCG